MDWFVPTQAIEANAVDFSILLPSLINLGPWGLVVGVFLYLRYEHGKEITAKDAVIDARDSRIHALHEGRLADSKAMLELRVADARDSQRVTAESTAALGRIMPVLETLGETIREIAEEGRIDRGIARDRESTARRMTGGTP